MTREEVKKELVDFFKDANVKKLKDDSIRIGIEAGVFKRVLYLDAKCIVILSYIESDYLMYEKTTNTFNYSQIKQILKTDEGINFILEGGTLISVEFKGVENGV